MNLDESKLKGFDGVLVEDDVYTLSVMDAKATGSNLFVAGVPIEDIPHGLTEEQVLCYIRAVDIINKKGIDINTLHDVDSYHFYNKYKRNADSLSEEEFRLLKEVLPG